MLQEAEAALVKAATRPRRPQPTAETAQMIRREPAEAAQTIKILIVCAASAGLQAQSFARSTPFCQSS